MHPLVVVFLRSLVLFVLAMFVAGRSAYESYWLTILHDIISLSLLGKTDLVRAM